MAETITIAGREFSIAPLKFRDLKRILPLFLRLGIDNEAEVEAQGEIITAAIAAMDGSFTRAAFDELTPTVQELQAAVSAVARLSGLKPRDTALGEAPAASLSIGESSTV
jgi:hypothetical protein